MKKSTHLFQLCLLVIFLCFTGTNNALADVTASVSGTTLTFSYSGSGSSAMTDYKDVDGSATPKRPGTWVFGVTKVVINEGVTTIGSYAFQGCSGITEIHIPTSVTECKAGAFIGCTGLANIYYAGTPNQWASIDFSVASSECTGHPFYATTASNHSFYFYDKATETKNIVFSAGLTQIKPYAFYRANYIEDVYIPGTVTSIGNYALYSSIKRLYINKSVAPTTGTNAISWLTSGTYIYLRADATNSYNKQPWINSSSGTSTGAKTIGYGDYSSTYVSCSWKTGKLHKVSGKVNNINWELSEDGTLTLTGNGAIATTFGTTTGNSNLLPWYRFRRLVNKVVIKANDGDITGISNAIQYCYAVDDIIIAQTTIPAATFSVANDFKKTTDVVNVYADTSSELDERWVATPWNNSRLNVTFTTTFCGDPSALNISNIGTTSATASWTDDRGESWKYLCVARGTTVTPEMWSSASTTTSKSVNVTGLTPGAQYTFHIISDCGSVGTSEVISENFSTDCGAISTLPWNYGFEGSVNDETPLCWGSTRSGGGSIGYVRASNSVSYKRSGSFGLKIYGGNTTNVVTAIFPEFDEEISNLELTFYYKADVTSEYDSYGQPQLGFVPTGGSFTPFGDPLPQRSTFGKVEGINMSNAPAGARFAIRYSGGSDVGYVSIDDITVTEKPSCNKPTGVSAGSETAEGATITWNANGMSNWKLQVSEGDAASWGEEIAVATNSKVLTGLKANTLYYVRVKADCGGGSVSEWSDNVSFTTLCGTINVNATTSWNEDFQSFADNVIPDCWDNSASTTTSSWGNEYIWGTYSQSTNRMLRMSNNYLDGGTALINTPSIAIPNDGKTYELTFDHSIRTLTGNDLKVKISSNGGAFTEKSTCYSEGSASSYPGDFTTATISLTEYSGQTIKIQFFANPASGTNSSDGAMFVDNVSVHKVASCFPPSALAAGNLTANSARITWTASASETAWRLQYRADGGSWSAEQAVSTNARHDISGLSANTLYHVRVKAYCDAEDQSEWSDILSFTTLCTAESMPFEEHFSSASELPSCWEATPASGTFKWGAYENSGAYSVQLHTGSSGSAELRMPAITLSEDAILRFEWKNVNGTNVNLYISTDGGSTKALLPNDLSGVHADWTTKIFDLSAFTGETALIYFAANFSTLNQYAYLDDVEVVARPCDMILNIQAAPITGGATISWSGNVKKLQYKTGSDAWSSVSIPSGDYAGPKSITGLAPARTYQVRLLPACSAEEEGNWTTSIYFVTSSTESVPYFNDFESETPGDVPFNWSRISPSEFPQVSHDAYAYKEGGGFGDQGNSIKFYGVNNQIIVLPEFNADLSDLKISFHYRNRDCKMELGYVAVDGVTFTAIETLPNQTGYGEFPYEKDLYGISSDAAKLAIRYSNAGGSAQAWVDNMSVDIATCGQPLGLTVSAITATSAHISWAASERGTESNYQYIRRIWNEDDPNWASATLISSSEHELDLTGLTPNKDYEFYLRSYCGMSDQSTPVKVEFKTSTADVVFEDVATATDNETRLAALIGQTVNVIIKRPLPLNGDYSTICLPFDLSAAQIANPDCPLHGFVIKEFDHSDKNDDVVDLFLRQVTSIEAGKPYFVRFAGAASDDRLSPLTFNNVKIKCSTPVEVESAGGVQPYGIFNPHALTGGDHTTYFLSSNNTLYWPSANGTINGFRVYVHIDPSTPLGNALYHGAPMRIRESSNSATGVDQVDGGQVPNTRKVLREGQIIIIRDGKEYNAQGMRIQ